MTERAGWRVAVLIGAGLWALPGCDKDKKDETASSTTATAASTAAPSASASTKSAPSDERVIVKYTLASSGKTAIDMPAPKEHIKADTAASAGTLDVDLANLANCGGEVKVDLATLKTHTFGEADKDDKQTEHALTWLEIGDKQTPETKEKNRWATFTIRSVDGLSASDVRKAPPEKTADGEVRKVTLTAHGEFSMHGHKVNKDAVLEARFHYPAGAAEGSKPTSLDLASKTPLHVILADHEVKPRDNFGALAQSAFSLLGTKVAETADVTLDLHATPTP
jgi:hypothetical protein